MCNILSLWIQTFTVGPAKMEPQEKGAFQVCSSTNTPAEKVVRGIFLTALLFFYILCLGLRLSFPARLQRAMQHQFDQTYGSLVFHHPKVARGHRDIAGVEGWHGATARGENERTRPETQMYFITQSLHASCVAADEIGDCNGFHFPVKSCCIGRLK